MTTKHTTTPTTAPEASQPQLVLVLDNTTARTDWQLDDETREIGRQGLAKARAALQAARPVSMDVAA